jgi:hypothetical protein
MPKPTGKWILFQYVDKAPVPLSKPFKSKELAEKAMFTEWLLAEKIARRTACLENSPQWAYSFFPCQRRVYGGRG